MGKSFLKGNSNCHILETEGRRKLKFSEVRLHICQNLLLTNIRAKTLFRPECTFKFVTSSKTSRQRKLPQSAYSKDAKT